MRYIKLAFLIGSCIFATSFQAKELPYQDKNLPIEQRVEDLLQRMTVEDKFAQIRHIHSWEILHGQQLDESLLESRCNQMCWGFVEGFPLTADNCRKNFRQIQEYAMNHTRLKIPMFIIAESLHGVVHEGATIFPQNIAMGSTFNPQLSYMKTQAIASELHHIKVNQVLAPCIDVVRELRWGRVEESFGEDPVLCGKFGIEEVNGYMNNGISPMLKHYGAHGNPLGGLNLASVDCGTRDLREVFLKPFEMVIRQTPVLAVMSSYNSRNRIPNSASKELMTDILRGEWNFKGYIYSDWGAIRMLKDFHRTASNDAEAADQALSAGLDVEASSNCYPSLIPLVKEQKYDTAIVNQAVRRVLYAKFALGLFEDPYGERYGEGVFHSPENVNLSRRIAEESVVLLKNNNQILPLQLSALRSIAVIGPNADQVQFGDYCWSKNNQDGVTPLQGIRRIVGDKASIRYVKGCDLASLDESGIAEAVDAAKNSDVALVFVGSSSTAFVRKSKMPSTSGEGIDLHDISLTGAQEKLVRAVHATGKPVVLVLVAGKPFAIPWEKDNMNAILVQWYGGEQAGNALADILFGNVSPSGRLNFSFPQSTGHLPAYYNYLPSDKGYYHQPGSYENPGRDYVFSSPKSLFCFGEGLTYTTFEYRDLQTDKSHYDVKDTINVCFTLSNTGKRSGKEVVQLYVRDKVSRFVTPVKSLRDFKKIELEAGKSVKVTLQVPVSELYVTDEQNHRMVEPGYFEMQVGASSDDIRLKADVLVGELNGLATVSTVASAKQQKSDRRIKVSGYVRDVQATPVASAAVYESSTGRKLGETDASGYFKVSTGNMERLRFQKKGYQTEQSDVNNRSTINVIMKNSGI